ncbi:transcriptional regulator, ArsR family protein [Fulvimarina pelagi HTCC2506]|uniref:Transcriptional regulator, ArsR family protein n=1 Tax=Fulvimarina pelagi HTCC2506 TaxID=314231 RepID=Q0G3I7_9HYPH|nr:helix-turn-helix domain-containing protein [Fulvimarina pelagi]EAU41844.1 transcriptional regulator, ArsR family protein [Fulvimarina pelagi HTCC2506]
MRLKHVVEQLAALAHADRLAAYRLLVQAGPNGMPSGEIAENLAVQPTRMSFHLSTLERANLLRSWRDGRRIRYAASFDEMRRLLGFLSEDCCGGRLEICGHLAESLEAASSCDEREAPAQ